MEGFDNKVFIELQVK